MHIPDQTGRLVQAKLDGQSTANWSASPRQSVRLVQSKLITFERANLSGITAMSFFGFTGEEYG